MNRIAVLILLLTLSCSTAEDKLMGADTDSKSGEFRVLNYNIWGLPEFITHSEPERRISLISPLLNDFEIALVQEDFSYHDSLTLEAVHPYQSESNNTGIFPPDAMGDGLNRFSRYPFSDMQRIPWPGCNGILDCGSDCLATKGYTYARHQIRPGVEIDIYNLHNEAGRCAEDYVVREESTDMMLADIAQRSAGRAVIVVGDFNLLAREPGDTPILERWHAAFFDVCVVLACEQIDSGARREVTYFRDGDQIKLTAMEHALGDDRFYDAEGQKLSNHHPQWARMGWEMID